MPEIKKDIPVHQLKDRTNAGFQIDYFNMGDEKSDEAHTFGAHRDDHYMFFLLEQGTASLMIDFSEVSLTGPGLYYVLPAQVHHRIRNEVAQGWFLAVDTALVPLYCRNVFEHQLMLQQPHPFQPGQLKQYTDLLSILYQKSGNDHPDQYHIRVMHALLESFLGMVAGCYYRASAGNSAISRSAEISHDFKKLLVTRMRDLKSPSAYAAELNVSESYLNEVLKKTTGFPVSYWIQQEVMMEAKRLLYYSDLNVKQIAHLLGYTDHSYFSRYFRKVVGVPASAFREQNRK